jgi:hypothetical protein
MMPAIWTTGIWFCCCALFHVNVNLVGMEMEHELISFNARKVLGLFMLCFTTKSLIKL